MTERVNYQDIMLPEFIGFMLQTEDGLISAVWKAMLSALSVVSVGVLFSPLMKVIWVCGCGVTLTNIQHSITTASRLLRNANKESSDLVINSN